MAGQHRFAVALVTVPDLSTARRLGRGAVQARLAACSNIVPKIESHYRWQGKIEKGAEILVLFKTTSARLKALETYVVANHPYDTPEFVVLPITRGNRRYLDWLAGAVA